MPGKNLAVVATPREAIAHYQALVDAGVQYFFVAIQGNDAETVRSLAEHVIPEIGTRVGAI